MTAHAISTQARTVLILEITAVLLSTVHALPTRAPTAKPTGFLPLPLLTLAPSSAPATADDTVSTSSSPTVYRDMNPPRPTYAGRDTLAPTPVPSFNATEAEEHAAECPNREKGCRACTLRGSQYKVSSYLTCPRRQSCHGMREDKEQGTRTRFCVCNPLFGLAASHDGATECSRWTSTTWVAVATYFLIIVWNVSKVVGGARELRRVFNARILGVIGPKGGGRIRPRGCLMWMISEPMARVLIITVLGQAVIAVLIAMEFFEATGWLDSVLGPWPFRRPMEALFPVLHLILYLVFLLIGMIWIEVRAFVWRDCKRATARMPL